MMFQGIYLSSSYRLAVTLDKQIRMLIPLSKKRDRERGRWEDREGGRERLELSYIRAYICRHLGDLL